MHHIFFSFCHLLWRVIHIFISENLLESFSEKVWYFFEIFQLFLLIQPPFAVLFPIISEGVLIILIQVFKNELVRGLLYFFVFSYLARAEWLLWFQTNVFKNILHPGSVLVFLWLLLLQFSQETLGLTI